MAKDEITLKITGREDIFADLRAIENDINEIVMNAFVAQQEVFEEGIRKNWVSMVGGSTSDFIYSSIGKNAEYGENGKSVVGMVGVFHMDYMAARYGRSKDSYVTGYRALTAPQIAYWVEFGTARLRSGKRKKGSQFREEDLIPIAPKPFVSTAFYSTLTEQENAFVKIFNEELNRITK